MKVLQLQVAHTFNKVPTNAENSTSQLLRKGETDDRCGKGLETSYARVQGKELQADRECRKGVALPPIDEMP